jgi:hypothetical protein
MLGILGDHAEVLADEVARQVKAQLSQAVQSPGVVAR